jgi:hypothetical protein
MRLAEYQPFPRTTAYPEEPISAFGAIQGLADRPMEPSTYLEEPAPPIS